MDFPILKSNIDESNKDQFDIIKKELNGIGVQPLPFDLPSIANNFKENNPFAAADCVGVLKTGTHTHTVLIRLLDGWCVFNNGFSFTDAEFVRKYISESAIYKSSNDLNMFRTAVILEALGNRPSTADDSDFSKQLRKTMLSNARDINNRIREK